MQAKSAKPKILSGRYRLDAVLGAGGMATVYRARDLVLDRTVAVKLLHPGLACDRAFLGRFLHEARAAARVSSHPNMVSVFDVGKDGESPFLVMEYIAGETLRQRLDRAGALDEVEATSIAKQLAGALTQAHRAGLVHRDVKPQNVLLTPDGGAKLTDFGIAIGLESTRLTAPGTVLGTAHYMSPEQARGEPGQAASDLYSLGAVLFEMMTSRPPFMGDTPASIAAQQSLSSPPGLDSLRPDASSELTRLVAQLMERAPAARPASADEVERRLSSAQEKSTINAPVTLRTNVRTRTGRRAFGVFVLLGGLGGLILGAFHATVFPTGHTAPPTSASRHRPAVMARRSPSPRPSVTVTPTAVPSPAPAAPPVGPLPTTGPARGHGRGKAHNHHLVPPVSPPAPKHDHGRGKGHDKQPNGDNGAGDQGNGGND